MLLVATIMVGTFIHAQRVGIGTTEPKTMLALDSGLTIDQGDHNTGTLNLANPSALIFGGDSKTGIYNNRAAGSPSRSSLAFVTGNQRRMVIDSVGNVGIGGFTDPNYRLQVFGKVMLSDLYVPGTAEIKQLSLNTSNTTATLYLKGWSNPPNVWGEHIILEDNASTEYAAIMYDGNGLKIRNFGLTDNFYFRNSDNITTLQISPEGNMTIPGKLFVDANNGIVRNNAAEPLKTQLYSGNLTINLVASGSITVGISFSTFSAIPHVSIAQIAEGTGSFDKVVYTVHNVTVNSATVTLYNPTNATAVINGSFKAIIIGAE